MRATAFVVVSVFAANAALPVYGDQTVIPDYKTARDDFFWPQIYVGNGATVYCGHIFGNDQERHHSGRRRARSREELSAEHTYPADTIAEAFGCPNCKECGLERYGHAKADLHILWPAVKRINSSRGKVPVGEPPGEQNRQFKDLPCRDYERTYGNGAVFEPRDARKGELARSVLYMNREYRLPVDAAMMATRFQMRDSGAWRQLK